MSTKLFIAAIVVLAIAVVAGVYASLNRADTTPPAANTNTNAAETTYTTEDVKEHDSKSSCWTIISDSVYDITSYVPRHPGGDEILRACGVNGTSLFKARQTSEGQPVGSGSPHSGNAEDQLKPLKIGVLAT